MKTYTTVSGAKATKINVECRLEVDDFITATAKAKALGFKSLKEFLETNIADLVYWKLNQDYEDAGFTVE